MGQQRQQVRERLWWSKRVHFFICIPKKIVKVPCCICSSSRFSKMYQFFPRFSQNPDSKVPLLVLAAFRTCFPVNLIGQRVHLLREGGSERDKASFFITSGLCFVVATFASKQNKGCRVGNKCYSFPFSLFRGFLKPVNQDQVPQSDVPNPCAL